MALKPALSFSDQIELLQNRGMNIDDEKQALSFLQSNHYYRLNIYFHKLMDSEDHFEDNVSFSQVIAIYDNDKWLRNKISTILEIIEINTRSRIAHHLATTYGADAFYQSGIFKDQKKYNEICDSFTNIALRNQRDPVIVHHHKKYAGLFPIWVIMEYFSFNTL